LLLAAGIPVTTRPVDVDEQPRGGESPRDYVLRVAVDKAHACPGSSKAVVLAADTTVVVADQILGKPIDSADAARMLRLLSGRAHLVLTGVVVRRGEQEVAAVESTEVTFAPLTEDDIEWYVATGESSDKAGAYAVQGLASRFIDRIDGSYSNVVGLPVATVCRLLAELEAGQ
jgi:septum formation protein